MSAPDVLSIANSAVSDLFKTKYRRYMDSHHNKMHPWAARVEKDTSVTGNLQTIQMKFGALGGYSAGSYQDAGQINYDVATFTMKKLYFRGEIDALSLNLSSDVAGAARKLADEAMLEANRETSRNLERQLVFGDGTGEIGRLTTSAVTPNGGGNYTLLMDSSFVRDNFHDGLIINIGATGTSKFRIDLGGVDKVAKSITVTRLDGSDVPVDSDIVYMQGSKDAEIQGLRGVLKATSGSKFGKTIGNGWKSEQLDADSDALNVEMILDVLYNIEHETGTAISDILVPLTQMKKLVHLGEAELLSMRYADVKSGDFVMGNTPHIFLEGVEVPIMRLLTVPPNEMYLVKNQSALLSLQSAGEGKFESSGSGNFLWYKGQFGGDAYEFFWRKYCEQFIHPAHHGVIYGLSTSTVA